jgi:glucosyl-3-phosphoglycerate phosphatase
VIDRLIAVRHGQTAWNIEGRFQGQADAPLDDTGRAQADAVAPLIADFHPDRIVASDLQRASETADVIGRACGLSVELSAELREIALGSWQGQLRADVADHSPQAFADWRARINKYNEDGETIADATSRVTAALLDVINNPDSHITVVVAHGLVLEWSLNELRAHHVIAFDGPVPHLGNAAFLDLAVDAAAATAFAQIR